MTSPAGSTATASVVFLSLVGFAKRPVAEQAHAKESLEQLIARAIAPLAASDRIVADQADGAAVAVLGSPIDALEVATRAARAAKEPLRVGVNQGPLGLAPDDHGDLSLVGDAIAAGASLTGFAEPGRVIVSRAFRDALAAEDPEHAELLRPAGTVTDAGLRAHELHAIEARGSAATGARAWPRRRVLVMAGFGAIGILAAGVAVRVARRAAARAKQPAVVELAITPWGVVVIDGEPKGKTPPVTRIEVPPGQHTIEVRHPQQPPVIVEAKLGPGEEFTLRHTFATPPPPPPAVKPAQKTAPKQVPQEQPSRVRRAWNEFRKSLPF
jgi:class 3 adenylate cyclase